MGDLTRDFALSDFACKDGLPVPDECLERVTTLACNLQVLRDHLGCCLFINSAYRSPKHNMAVGGVDDSVHLYGGAADIYVDDMDSSALSAVIEALIEQGKLSEGGVGCYESFVHYDVRGTRARW